MFSDIVQSWRGESKLEETHTVECIGHIGAPGSSYFGSNVKFLWVYALLKQEKMVWNILQKVLMSG